MKVLIMWLHDLWPTFGKTWKHLVMVQLLSVAIYCPFGLFATLPEQKAQVIFIQDLCRSIVCHLLVFSAPEPKAQVHYCDHALSVVRPSVCPSLTFHIFDFSSETTEQNSMKLERKQDLNVLYQVCVFRADRKNKMAALASDWLRHLQLLLWNRWTEFNETWQEARSQRPLPSLCFLGRSKKQDGCPCLWLVETFSTSPLKPLNGIQWNLTGSKISTSSTKFVFFGPNGKTRWPPWPLIGWVIFYFSSETAERNSTKLDRKQDLNILYQVCVFRADQKNKMAALASDWLRHFRLFLWNSWTEFNETWQEARFQCPLPSLFFFSGRSKKQDCRPGLWLAESFSTYPLKPLNRIQRNLTGSKISTSSTKFFFGPIGKQDGRPGLWLAETFSTSPLKPLNRIQRNLTRSKISTSSTKFVFFGPIGKTRWPPWPLIGWVIFDFSTETAERNSMKLDRKQDLNDLYQVFFGGGAISKQKCLPWLIPPKGGILYSGARYVALWASCSYFPFLENHSMDFSETPKQFSRKFTSLTPEGTRFLGRLVKVA